MIPWLFPKSRNKPNKCWQRKESPLGTLGPLTKANFKAIKSLHQKKNRLEQGSTFLEGERLVLDALKRGLIPRILLGTEEFWGSHQEIIHLCAGLPIEAYSLNESQFESLALTDQPSGALAVISTPRWQTEILEGRLKEKELLGLLAVGIQDPGNLGALIRTAAAAGASGVWLSKGCVDAFSPKVIRSSAGTILTTPVVEQVDEKVLLEKCRSIGIQSLAAVPKQGRAYTTIDFTGPTLLVLGSEGSGLSNELIQLCRQSVHIPMPGDIQSLNISMAGGIIIYEMLRQRRLVTAKMKVG